MAAGEELMEQSGIYPIPSFEVSIGIDGKAEVAGMYGMVVYSRKDISASQELNLPIETERYKIEDASYVDGVPAYEIKDKETGRGLYIREDQLMIQKDEKTGLEFVINMDQPFSCNVLMTEELKGLLDEMAGKRGIDLQEVPMPGGLTVNQDPKTGLCYLSIQGNEAKGVSIVMTSKEDWEILEKLADEFQKYSVSSQRSTAGLYALPEISGNLKREEYGFTILTLNGITYIPYDGNPSKAWEIEMPASDYSAARKYLAMGIEASNYQTWLSKLNNVKLPDSISGSPHGLVGSNPTASAIGKPHKLSIYAVFPYSNDFYGRNKIPAVLLFSDYCYHDFQDNTAVKHPLLVRA